MAEDPESCSEFPAGVNEEEIANPFSNLRNGANKGRKKSIRSVTSSGFELPMLYENRSTE